MEGKNWFKERQKSLNRIHLGRSFYNRRQDQIVAKRLNPPQQQQSSQPIGKATPGYQPQGPPGKPYGFRNQTTGEWEWFSTMDEMNAAKAGGGTMPQVNPDYIKQNFSQLYRNR